MTVISQKQPENTTVVDENGVETTKTTTVTVTAPGILSRTVQRLQGSPITTSVSIVAGAAAALFATSNYRSYGTVMPRSRVTGAEVGGAVRSLSAFFANR